jgi:hypothetical protein
VLIPIGIIFFTYELFFPEVALSVKNKDTKEILARLVEADRLIGFYASIIAVIGVLITITGRIVWKKIQEAYELTEKLREVEDKVNLLNKEEMLAKWAKEKVDKVGLHTFKIENLTPEDRKKIEEISEYMIQNWANTGWLELFMAHRIMTEERDFEKAESTFELIEKRSLFFKKDEFLPLLYHFKGQCYWGKYLSVKHGLKLNYFRAEDKNLKKPGKKAVKEAIDLLKKSVESYRNAIFHAEQVGFTGQQLDPSMSNFALVLIEISKFYYYDDKNLNQGYLNKAEAILEEVFEKIYDNYYGLARVYYYKNDMEKSWKCFEQFHKRLEFLNDKEKFIIKNRFEEHKETENKEFDGEGFPSKLEINLKKNHGDH